MGYISAAPRVALFLLAVVLLVGLAAPPPAHAQLNVTGQWSTMSTLAPVQPIHVALLHTGKVLMIEGSSNDSAQTIYRYTVWNPATGTFSTGTTPWDLFCNSMSFFPDGRLLISGGNLSYDPFTGLKTTTIFDPATEKFIQVEDTAKGRWYPTTVGLQDGGVMTFSGLDENGDINPQTEIYDVGFGWAGPYTAQFGPKYYPRLHLLPTGKVLMTGPDPSTRTFDPANATWTGTILLHPNLESRMYGTSVMLPLKPQDGYAARVFVTGGNTAEPYAGAHILDTSVASWSWRAVPSLDQARVTHSAVLLPNGKVLVAGGSSVFVKASTAAMNALLFDPTTETWGPAGKIAFPRMYHSTALLLPDATVWVGGSNPSEGTWTPQMEIYKPPYLFTSSGAPAARPTISSAPAVLGYGAPFTVGTPDAQNIAQVILVRPGSATHAFDMEQRLIHMQFTKGAGTLTATTPPNAMVAPPGHYMLFVLDQNGVPSVAKFVRLSANPSNQAPVATITNPSSATVSIQAGQSVTFAGSATDPDGSVVQYQWLFPGGSPAKSTVQNPGAVTFSTPGSYTASLTVLDNIGENNVSPPTVTVVVGGAAPALGAAITSPASGATVSGTVIVNMAATNGQGSPNTFVLKLDNTTTLSTQSVSASTASFSWNTTGVASGSHTLNLAVTDGAGRTATTAIPVTVGAGGGGGGGDTTQPTVSITSPPNGAWTGNSIGISVSGADNVGLANIKLWGNGASFATIPCSSASCTGTVWWVTGPLPPAAYEVNAVATDTAGNQTVSATITIYKDAKTPVVASGASPSPTPTPALGASITSPASGATVSGTVTVNMAATNAQGSPNTFVLKLDNATTLSTQSVGGSTASFSWSTTGVANGSHTLNLAVTDGAGRTATAAIPVTVSNGTPGGGGGGGGGDTTKPTVSITSPPNGAWTGNSIGISVSGADNVGLANIKLWGNGGSFGTVQCSGASCTGTVWWTTGPLPPAAYEVNAVATDTAGNQTVSATITIYKDAKTPVVASGASGASPSPTPTPALGASITSPTSGATVSGTVTVNMAATNAQGSPNTFVLTLDNATTLSTQSVGGSTASFSWSTTGVANGSHTLNLAVTDGAGRTATAAIPVTVSNGTPGGGGGDTTPPTVSITSPKNGDWTGNSIKVIVTGTDNIGLASIGVFGNGSLVGTVPCSGTTCTGEVWWTTGPLPSGKHTITAVATDTAGNKTTSAPIVINK